MAEFINTIDVLGDDAVIDSIIDRTITEFKDNSITTIGEYAFNGCTKLVNLSLPLVEDLWPNRIAGCTALETIEMPKLKYIRNAAFTNLSALKSVFFPDAVLGNDINPGMGAFQRCTNLEYAYVPKVQYMPGYFFYGCSALKMVDLHVCNNLGNAYNWVDTKNMKVLILRSPDVAVLPEEFWGGTGVGDGTCYIYVPRALVDSYKAATNWSSYATQFRALEDNTLDGTTTGKLAAGVIHYDLQYMLSSNTETFVTGSYRTTLTVLGNNPFVSVTMDGVDITTDVYNSETHEIVIPLVAGDIVITATAEFDRDASSIYELPAPTTFNGTSDYIDTGIKLFDIPKDFTIVCSADFSALEINTCLLHCMNEAVPYPGLSVDGNGAVRVCYTGASSLTTTIANRNNVSALALRIKAGVLDAIRYKDTSGNIVTVAHNTTAKYTAITQNLLLGAYQSTDGTKGRYYKGTVESFRVFGASLPDEIITDELQMA